MSGLGFPICCYCGRCRSQRDDEPWSVDQFAYYVCTRRECEAKARSKPPTPYRYEAFARVVDALDTKDSEAVLPASDWSPPDLEALEAERQRVFVAEMSGLISDFGDVPDPGMDDLPGMAAAIRAKFEALAGVPGGGKEGQDQGGDRGRSPVVKGEEA